MTTFDDGSPLPGSVAPGVPWLDLAATQAAVEHAIAALDGATSRAEAIDRIAEIRRLRNSLAALETETARAFALAHVAVETAHGRVEPEKLERSIGSQVGYACRVSQHQGRKIVRVARDLHCGLDHVRRRFAAGDLDPEKVAVIVTAAADLDAQERAEVDRRLSERRIELRGIGWLREHARKVVAEVAPEKFLQRCRTARENRRVTLRPAPDGMTDLTAHLPLEQGIACLAALQKAFNAVSVDPAPMTRTKGQVMADTLVERVTGQVAADAVDVQVQIMVPIEVLVDPNCPLPAEIPGYGPVPADLIATTRGRKSWKRLVTRKGVVIGGDSRKRRFTGRLADLIRARDRNRCREPWCDSPSADIDHVIRAEDGGPTAFEYGRCACRFHNLLREEPGWTVERVPGGIRTTTPTGHRYLSPDG